MKNDFKPYYAVIFTSVRTDINENYLEINDKLEETARTYPGFLGVESARNELGVSVSYWESPEAIMNWKRNTDHLFAQQKGKEKWYTWYKVRICRVEREYEFNK